MNAQTPLPAAADLCDQADLLRRVEALERENGKLKRINTVLMERVERSMDFQGGAYSLFQTAIVLERKVRERTLELEKTLQELESSHADLARAKELAVLMRERLSEAIESVNEGFALFDADDRLVLCNTKYLACWPELSKRIAPGMRFREIAEMAALSRSVSAAHPRPDLWLNNRMAQRAELNGPYIHSLSDGRWLQVTERRTRDGGIVGLYTDITDIKENETKRREQELAAKSALLQATLDNIVQGVSVYDRDEKLAAWNDRFVELLRLPANVARADASFSDLVIYNSALGDRGLPLAALTAADRVVEQTVFGDTVLEIRRSAMPDGGFVMTFADITERKQAEEALRDGERRIRLITDAVPALIAYVDADERYRFVNHAYEECFNLLRYELEGQTMREALGPEQYALRLPHIMRALAGEEAHFELQMPADDDGLPRYAVATYVPHFGGRREVLGFFALIHDITERRRVAEELRDAKESLERRVIERTAELTRLNGQLQQEIGERAAAEEALRLAKADAETANLSKTKFLAAASHDLLQPLNAARLFVSALMDLEQPTNQRSLVENLDGALSSVEDLLSALLDISRLDAGAVRPEIGDFPIKSLLSALSSEYTAVALDRGLKLKVMPSSAVVHSDPRLLRRIIQNFVSNALRYTQTGRVLLGCRRRRRGLVIEVWDTGPGVPADKMGEIFEEFRRLDSPTPHGRDRGIGLGLAIVDRVARMLGHEVQVRSEYRRGSVFSVTVPYGSFTPRADRPVKTVKRVANRLNGLTVMVLDNEPAVIAGMRALLEGWSCAVMTAGSGDEALTAMVRRGGPPDLLIADYHLDDGALGVDEIVRIRKAAGRPVPAVLVTANRTPELVEEAKRMNIPVLNKPVKPAQLRALISGIVG